MASHNYNSYNYPYQHSSTQQYSGYQTAPASNVVSQSSHQYQSTTQATDYMSYQAHPYGGQESSYGGAQDSSWAGNSYGGNRETTSRAAEVLRNMSNTAYAPNNAAPSQPGFTATNASTVSRYSTNTPQAQPVLQPPQSHTAASSYGQGQGQARPRSVNTDRVQGRSASPRLTASYSSQRPAQAYSQHTQRSHGPAQPPHAQSDRSSAGSAQSIATYAGTHYGDHNRRQLPRPDGARSTNLTVSASYSYPNDESVTPVVQTSSNNAPETFQQSATTVDPSAVYDPWPEYQRKQETLRAQKAIDDAAQAEAQRAAEEAHRKEERRKEADEKARQMPISEKNGHSPQQSATVDSTSAVLSSAAANPPMGADMEDEIRALMAKMRDFNSKDPALLARIWEEERRAKAPKSPTIQTKPTPAVRSAPVSVPQVANQRKKAVPKEASPPAAAKVAKAVVAQPAVKATVPVTVASNRAQGNTIWPPEKKAHLAMAASVYLNGLNPDRNLQSEEILRMLDSNPSYIELCEQLENMRLRLDRAAFAKTLLSAVPDVNNASRSKPTKGTHTGPVKGVMAQTTLVAPPAIPAIMKVHPGTPATSSATYNSAPAPYSPFSGDSNAAPTAGAVAEMIQIKPEIKPPANKEEAARKRSFGELIDLTQLPEEESVEPPVKKYKIGSMYSYGSPGPAPYDLMDVDDGTANFPIASRPAPPPREELMPPLPMTEIGRHITIVDTLDRKKALRRNTYNIKTIARDVLLACGRHPSTRQLNQHLDGLRTTLPQVGYESDLSTLRWDSIDPGNPPPGYFKDGVQGLAEDADDEDDSENEDRQPAHPSSAGKGTGHKMAQALPEATNPFKQKRRGRPPRHSNPENATALHTPNRSASAVMSASAPRSHAAGVGYSAFRPANEFDADGKPMPKKKGRPVGWRKSLHGSAAAQAQSSANSHAKSVGPRFAPSQPSTLRNVATGNYEPIRIDSRSPSVLNKVPRHQSFKCHWDNCKAELHNLGTLKKHVHKVHQKKSLNGSLECLWADCGSDAVSDDPTTNTRLERHAPKTFHDEGEWQEHLEHTHFTPLSWQLGSGPASGLSDVNDSEAYLSDAQGRRVTPRISARHERLEGDRTDESTGPAHHLSAVPRGRGRPPRDALEQEARDLQNRLVSQKRRVGGPGMDRGGATFVNEKRRKGFSDNDETEEQLVDADD